MEKIVNFCVSSKPLIERTTGYRVYLQKMAKSTIIVEHY